MNFTVIVNEHVAVYQVDSYKFSSHMYNAVPGYIVVMLIIEF